VPTNSGLPGWWIAAFVIAAVLAVGGGIWRWAVLRQGGLNPFVAREQLEVLAAQRLTRDAADASLKPAPKTVEERLAELDDLHSRGVITDAERTEARAKIISEA
jgi:hypothetical protein